MVHGAKKSDVVNDPYFRDYFGQSIVEPPGKDDVIEDDLEQFKSGAEYLKRNG